MFFRDCFKPAIIGSLIIIITGTYGIPPLLITFGYDVLNENKRRTLVLVPDFIQDSKCTFSYKYMCIGFIYIHLFFLILLLNVLKRDPFINVYKRKYSNKKKQVCCAVGYVMDDAFCCQQDDFLRKFVNSYTCFSNSKTKQSAVHVELSAFHLNMISIPTHQGCITVQYLTRSYPLPPHYLSPRRQSFANFQTVSTQVKFSR